MTAKSLTYGQIFDKLKELGFEDQIVTQNGNRHRIFQHKQQEKAMIFLPDVKRGQPAASMHINAVRAVLKAHGIINEDEFLLV